MRGRDLSDTVKQAAQRGMIPGPQVFAGLAMRINGVEELGLEITQGMMLGESFYWDTDEATRAWSKRFFERVNQMPNSVQAGVYSSTMHYLQAVAQAGTVETEPVMKAMRAMPIDDFFAHDGEIRADGVMVHAMRLFQVKTLERIALPLGLSQAGRDDPGQGSLCPARPVEMPTGEAVKRTEEIRRDTALCR